MRLCISSQGEDLNSFVDPRFGRCQFLLIIEAKKKKAEITKVIKNQNVATARGAGIATSQLAVNEKPDAIITGNIGPNAFQVLQTSDIKIYSGIFGLTIAQTIEKFNAGEIKQAAASTVAGHFGQGRCGPGAGARRGHGPQRSNF